MWTNAQGGAQLRDGAARRAAARVIAGTKRRRQTSPLSRRAVNFFTSLHFIGLDDPSPSTQKRTGHSVKRHFGPNIFFACVAPEGASSRRTCHTAQNRLPRGRHHHTPQCRMGVETPGAGVVSSACAVTTCMGYPPPCVRSRSVRLLECGLFWVGRDADARDLGRAPCAAPQRMWATSWCHLSGTTPHEY